MKKKCPKKRHRREPAGKLAQLFLLGIVWDGIIGLDAVFLFGGYPLYVALTSAIITWLASTSYRILLDPSGQRGGRLAALMAGSAIGGGAAAYIRLVI